MSASRQKRIERAQMKVLFTVPFFAPGVAKLPVVLVESDPPHNTASTDGKVIRMCNAFLDSLADAEIPTLLVHEVSHPMLGHLWRAPEGADWDLWNQACDHAVNLMLKEFSETVMAQKVADPFPFPKPPPGGSYCADPRFKGMNEEAIYQVLLKEKQSGKGGKQGKQAMPAFGQFDKPGNGVPDPNAKGKGAGGAAPQSSKQLQNDWTATLLQSARLAKGQGSLPGGLQRLVDDIVEPKINWVDVLRSWLREQCADDWNWLAPAMEYEGSGFILPSLKSEKMGPVVFGSDWSGSTFGDLVKQFHAEKQNCLDEMRPSKLIDIGFDTRVIWEKEYELGDTIDPRIAGGGGTSFVEVLQRCAELQPAPKCVVILTDLDGAFPKDPPPFPVVWVAYGTKSKAPFGDTIYAE